MPKSYRGGDPVERFGICNWRASTRRPSPELVHDLKSTRKNSAPEPTAHRDAESARGVSRRYVDLYNFAPIGDMTINSSGTIREMNLTAAGVLGRERGKFVGLPFSAFVLQADKPRFSEHLRQCLQAEHSSVTPS